MREIKFIRTDQEKDVRAKKGVLTLLSPAVPWD